MIFSCTIGMKNRFVGLQFPGLKFFVFFFKATITFANYPQMYLQTSEGQMLCTRNISSAMPYKACMKIPQHSGLVITQFNEYSTNLLELFLLEFC